MWVLRCINSLGAAHPPSVRWFSENCEYRLLLRYAMSNIHILIHLRLFRYSNSLLANLNSRNTQGAATYLWSSDESNRYNSFELSSKNRSGAYNDSKTQIQFAAPKGNAKHHVGLSEGTVTVTTVSFYPLNRLLSFGGWIIRRPKVAISMTCRKEWTPIHMVGIWRRRNVASECDSLDCDGR